MSDTPIFTPNSSDAQTADINERRLTLKLLRYWEKMRGLKAMPSEEDINPEDLGEMWDHCFLIHTAHIGQSDYNFLYLGDGIKASFIDAHASGIESADMLNSHMVAPRLEDVLTLKSPVIDEGSIALDGGQQLKYRQCLLPLGKDDKILAIWGGMRCKIYSKH